MPAVTPRMILKLIELLQLLGDHRLPGGGGAYFPRWQVQAAYDLRNRIVGDPAAYDGIEALAAEYGMSASRLRTVFKGVFGTSVYGYVREHRLERAAASLLGGERGIAAIAQEAGYANPSKFAAAFKGRFGVTPTQYRNGGKA